MKRKILVILLSLFCVICLSFGLAACDLGGDVGDNQSNLGQGDNNTANPDEDNGGNVSNGGSDSQGGDSGNSGDGGNTGDSGSNGNADNYYGLIFKDEPFSHRGYVVLGLESNSYTDIVIPESYDGRAVIAIYNNAFYGHSEIKSIEIPNSIEYISSGAFSECSGLTSIVIPESVTWIGDYAFYNCSGLQTVRITGSLPIGNSTFYGCSALEKIPENISKIGTGAFANCSGLKQITIPDSVTSIGSEAFDNCQNVTDITISNSVSDIWDAAFSGCDNLVNLTIPYISSTLGRFFERASTYSSSKTTIPNIVGATYQRTVDHGLSSGNKQYEHYFYYIPKTLRKVTVTGKSIPERTFYNCSMLTDIVLENTETIGESAFYSCLNIKNLVIPDSTKTITEGALNRCYNLESITIPFVGGSSTASTASKSTLFGYIFGSNSYAGSTETRQAYNIEKLSNGGFSLTTATYYIPDSLTSVTVTGEKILTGAFSKCSNIKNINLLRVKTIGIGAFLGCSNLESIKIANSLTTIDSDAFYNCNALNQILYGGTIEQWIILFGSSTLNNKVIPNYNDD